MHLSKICIDPIGPEQIQNGMSVSIPCETEISVSCPAGKVCYHKESITFYETQRLIFGQTNEGKVALYSDEKRKKGLRNKLALYCITYRIHLNYTVRIMQNESPCIFEPCQLLATMRKTSKTQKCNNLIVRS